MGDVPGGAVSRLSPAAAAHASPDTLPAQLFLRAGGVVGQHAIEHGQHLLEAFSEGLLKVEGVEGAQDEVPVPDVDDPAGGPGGGDEHLKVGHAGQPPEEVRGGRRRVVDPPRHLRDVLAAGLALLGDLPLQARRTLWGA
jgi:hypothetical protein